LSLDLFAEQDALRFYGLSFTTDDVHEAAKFLLEVELIRGIKTWGPVLARPELTARGRQCVEMHDGNVRSFLSPPGLLGGSVTYHQNFNAPVTGQVAQGQSVN